MKIIQGISRKNRRSIRQDYEDAASTIEAFLNGTIGPWNWDDFTSIKQTDPVLESVRLRCSSVYAEYPATEKGHYCNSDGFQLLRELAQSVRTKRKSIVDEEDT
jgi:hypothetical protein